MIKRAIAILVGGLLALGSLGIGGCGRDAPAAPAAPAPKNTVTLAMAAVAPRPTGALPTGASCVTAECHATYKTAPHIHGPVSQGACDACHQPDAGGHKYPLKRDLTQTCTFCHQVAGNKSHQHQAIAQQGCVGCHNPHISNAKYLLQADSTERLCAKCHDLPLKKHAHAPFANGQCTLCHQPHESDTAKLLRGGNGPDHCLSCHGEIKQALAQPHAHAPAKAQCTTCHGPHATDQPHQLKAPLNANCLSCHKKLGEQMARNNTAHGALLTNDGCANCHDPHGTAQPALLRQRMDKLCLTCHDKPLTANDGRMLASLRPALESKNLHGPVRSGNCSDCHDPHTGTNHDLLRLNFTKSFYAPFDLGNYALCFSCHDQQLVLSPKTTALTGFRDGDKNLHYLHVNRAEKGRTCKTCHDMHGSDLPRHMASSVPFEGSAWAMPIRYEAKPEGGRCTPGCHGPQEYDRTRGAAPATSPAEKGTP